MTTPRLEAFAAYMVARHQIYLDRKAGKPGPWTTDPILSQYRFCNIFRELDTVTQWINDNIRVPFEDHEHLWFMLAIARYINHPPTLAELINKEGPYWPNHPSFWCGDFGHPDTVASPLADALQDRMDRGETVWTGAYMIRAESDPNKYWYSWSKQQYIADIVLGRLWEDREHFKAGIEKPGQTLQGAFNLFMDDRYCGWGPFMTYEVITDLRWTRYLKEAPDRYSWANAGPGAIRGLNRMYGRDLSVKPRAEQTNEEMRMLMNDLNDLVLRDSAFKEVFAAIYFEMRDVEHTLCEFDKYERVRLGEGRPRSKYNWRNATKL